MSIKIWKCHALIGGPLHYVSHLHKMKFVTIIADGDCLIICANVLQMKPHKQHIRRGYWSVLLIFPFVPSHFDAYKGFVSILCLLMVLQAIYLPLGPSSTWTVFPLSSKVFLIIAIVIFLQNSCWGYCSWDLAQDWQAFAFISEKAKKKEYCRFGHHFVLQVLALSMGSCPLLLWSSTQCFALLLPE